jgi:acyl carrier protein
LPSAIVLLEKLPLTPNGKVDCRGLPAPSGEGAELQSTFVAARNPLEEILRSIWEAVLKREPIGVEDHFFELGGNSLLATQVMSRMHDALQVELPLRAIFENPTIAGLAASIARMQGEVEEESIDDQLLAKIERLTEEEAASQLLN